MRNSTKIKIIVEGEVEYNKIIGDGLSYEVKIRRYTKEG